ncbi:MAG: ParB/RepB/Spo0J family partition protein, partial [Alphaproteobacteria bacterium]|nr:ParB/RepB/Spo0J family partition protein [Alphaproteobacteria bacterium]
MTDKKAKPRTGKRGLGRGLATLIGDTHKSAAVPATPSAPPSATPSAPSSSSGAQPDTQNNIANTINTLAIDQLVAGAYQPRRAFDEEAIAALAESFRQNGILQPLIVRPLEDEAGKQLYEIVAGERRFRAAQIAQLHQVPVVVRSLSDVQALEIGVVENVQREGLNPIEEAEGYRRLAEEFHYTQADIAEIVGKSRSYITNILRVLDAPTLIRDYIIAGRLTAGHARALVGSATAAIAETLAQQVVAQGLNVRATEQLVARQKAAKDKKTLPLKKSVDILAL